MNLHFDINLTEGQRQAYDLIHRKDVQFLVLRWSRQCGKSVLAEVLLIEWLFKEKTYNAYVSPSYNLGRKVYSEIVKMLEPTGIIKKANGTTLTIETTLNSTLQFLSMEAYTSIRGLTINGMIVLDECSYYPDVLPNGEEPWGNILMPIVKARKPKVVFISTPRGKRGMFYDAYLRAKAGDKGYAELSRTIYDDELVSEDDIADIRKSISEIAFRQEFLVEFLDSSLTFFKGFEECFTLDKYTGGKCWVGVDLSSSQGNDNTIVTAINEKSEVKQYLIDGTLDVKYRKISEIIDKLNPTAVYLENNGIGSPMINEIRKLVRHKNKLHEWTTTNATKEDIISELAVRIAGHEIAFEKEDNGLYSEFGSFVVKYTKTGKMQFEALSGRHDDRIMSLAIALRCKKDFKYTGQNNSVFINTNKGFIR